MPWTSRPVGALPMVNASWNETTTPPRHLHRAHDRILDVALAIALLRRDRDDILDLVVEEEPQRVGVMDGQVEDRAATRRGIPDPPGPEEIRQLDRVEDPDRERLPDRTFLE